MILLSLLEFERRALENSDGVVLASSHHSEGSSRSKVTAIDGLRLSANFTNRCSSLGHKNVAKSLSTLSNHHNTLTISRPSDVFDGPAYRLKLIFQQMLLVDGIPDANLARSVARCNIETRRRIFSYINRARMLSVDIRDSWILKIGKKFVTSSLAA